MNCSLYRDPILFSDGKLYFIAENSEGRQLWSTDGSEEGTMLLQGLGWTSFYGMTTANGTMLLGYASPYGTL